MSVGPDEKLTIMDDNFPPKKAKMKVAGIWVLNL